MVTVHACMGGYTICGIETDKLPEESLENDNEITCDECVEIIREAQQFSVIGNYAIRKR